MCGLKIILIILKIIFDLENIIFKNSMQIKKKKRYMCHRNIPLINANNVVDSIKVTNIVLFCI